MVVRWTNLIEAILLALGGLAAMVFLPEAVNSYGREPEDVWLLSFWLVFCLAFGGLCLWNALSVTIPCGASRRPLLISNWTATALLIPVALAGIGDIVLLMIGAVALMGPVAQLLRFRHTRQRVA
ncbi:hypothetical protein CQ035_02370 [Brevundimonas sp. MYb46]|nr:hypothetical protein CQ026_02425 [Brevundimonas sp. MYb31]PRA34441.1 hypothetical protein CQ024_03490 [Brevundimonas sp. MYb27]PRB17886.1 hypothetical protein CQ039_02370 [Brevundimonas sp. MYb52]PRB38257.1 hypothetical protein CQ035_02370 [Brevundimonas sp. MYb46]PRB55962.1 hypothetical protein CQ028_00565 [Brevundimonas sp. MYb33]